MSEPIVAGGGYTCQECGITFETNNQLVFHAKEHHPTSAAATNSTDDLTSQISEKAENIAEKAKEELTDVGDKMKAAAKTMENKVKDPDKDIKQEYDKKKAEEKVK